MKVTYSPPYDSPIEDIFARHYVKYASDAVELTPQFEVQTLCGLFIVDFVVQDQAGYRVEIECDGKEFHNDSRDEWRDAMILGEGHLDAIYRVRGSDLKYYFEDVLYLLAELEPNLFNPRSLANLKVLASPEVQKISKSHDNDNYFIRYRSDEDIGSFHLEARRRRIPVGQHRFWQDAFKYLIMSLSQPAQ